MSTSSPEIGYILKGFGRTSETFISREIALLERRGVPMEVYSLLTLTGQQRHAVVDAIQAPVTYLPETTSLTETSLPRWLLQNGPRFAPSHARLFAAGPGRYLGALGEALRRRDRASLKEFLQAGFIAERVRAGGRIRHLHAHFGHTATTVAMLVSRLTGLPFSFTAHAKDIYVAELNPGDLLQEKLRRAKFVVTCTEANRAHLEALTEAHAPIHTIYHGLDLDEFAPVRATPGPRSLLLAVGRMVEKKGFPDLVDACARLRDRGYEFECRIIGGGGNDEARVEARIREQGLGGIVQRQSAVTQETLRGMYAQAAAFALPCRIVENGDRDGIPNVLVEAMAMGLAVVSTRVSGIPELIDDGVNGLLVPSGDAGALADALARLLDDPALRNRLGEAARDTVRRRFDAKLHIESLRRLFLECLR